MATEAVSTAEVGAELALRMYAQMQRIRFFEERVDQLYRSAKMPGLAHLYVGEEAVAVGVCEALRRDDFITSTHRGHGHCLAKGASPDRMFCELLGKELFLVEPLFYHSALLYERHGCAYLFGQDLMAQIDAEFQVGGRLHAALDGETVFRQPGLERTARGRSWAVHDGILSVLGDAPWGGVKMYRQCGRPAGISSFPGGAY